MMWPDGMKSACCLTFDLDAETAWLEVAPDIENPIVLSLGNYGPRRAIPKILELLEKHEVKGTFFIPGKIAEDYPGSVEAIIESGHEIAAHSYKHTAPEELSEAEEVEDITRTLAILKGFGVDIQGYRIPSWGASPRTFDLLEEHGFKYSSNMMNDVMPYRHPEKKLIELPVQWMLDDWIHFGFAPGDWEKSIATPSAVLEIWSKEFAGIHEWGGVFVPTMHPQIIGRPSRINMLDEFISFVKSHEGVWIAPCSQVAEHLDSVLT
jgi:peptidoglycan/xylan/chitin deacetylase (PgdA/CDA1 family)